MGARPSVGLLSYVDVSATLRPWFRCRLLPLPHQTGPEGPGVERGTPHPASGVFRDSAGRRSMVDNSLLNELVALVALVCVYRMLGRDS
jgi:hypothetical protein